MNYFAHALPHLGRVYFMAGLAVPDWISVIDRRVRTPARGARELLDDQDPRVRETAAGIIRHHDDDRWFHQTRAFAELNFAFANELRAYLPDDSSMRPGLLAHIAVELLLDARLMELHPRALDRYYNLMENVEPELIETVVNRISRQPTDQLAALIARFMDARFLADYGDDARLLYRLSQVMQRVGLPALPETLLPWLADARRQVDRRTVELLTPPGFDQPAFPLPSA